MARRARTGLDLRRPPGRAVGSTAAYVSRARFDPHSGAIVAAAAVTAGVLVGTATAIDPRLGIALLLGACAVPLVLIDVVLGLALWAMLMPLANLPGFGLGATAAGLLAILSWLGLPHRERVPLRESVGGPVGAGALMLLLAWISLSLGWAENPGTGARDLWQWYVGAIILAVVVTSLRRLRDARLVLGGFVLGVVLSVLVGLVNDGLGGPGAGAADTLTSTEGRLQGGLGDPNILAAAIVPAIVLAAALAAVARPQVRWALLGCVGVLVVGLTATQSRGGAVGAAAAFAVGLLAVKGRRKHVLRAGLGAVLVSVLYFSAYPNALDRLESSDRGNGRVDIWRVAWRITEDRPLTGVGLHNFTVHSPRYVRQPGRLDFVDLIAERPHAVHNTYLELLTETGVVGLGLFLAVVSASLGAAWKAARQFEHQGDEPSATLARGVAVATVGVLTAGMFATMAPRPVLWFLLALGPGLLVVSGRAASSPEAVGRAISS
jgi:O-antigen ligase